MFDSPSCKFLPHARLLEQLLALLKQRQGQSSTPLLELINYTLVELRFRGTSKHYFHVHTDCVSREGAQKREQSEARERARDSGARSRRGRRLEGVRKVGNRTRVRRYTKKQLTGLGAATTSAPCLGGSFLPP